ncbi:hypothetical protein M569_09237 [Genlisea aurea]|uniref:Kinesin motor domain-containing protein n=1 Tax=Genlisea aurea TaxID=192259 RepID=S8CF90_9LAMI|nr:hypothetical protein M569_09237 [Genlisea aurea]
MAGNNRSSKLRIVGKIRGYTEKEFEALDSGSEPWITVENGDRSTVCFGAPSSRCKYELDGVYGQHEGTDAIYCRDVKPLVSGAFEGQSSSFIALGARGSGKTNIMQGTKEKPGLVVLAMMEILEKATEVKKLVSISVYEVVQNHAYDVLDSEHHEVPVRSITEFCNVYFIQGRKLSKSQPLSHKGLMVNISSEDGSLESKINFVEFSGFELYDDPYYDDARRSLKNGMASADRTWINKSLYALLNVIAAIGADEIHVPYRENKLTRILQDSLGGSSHGVLLACANPLFCQDTVGLFSIVSRSFRINKKVLIDTTNTIRSSAKWKALSASRNRAVIKINGRPGFFSAGRKLFAEERNCSKQGIPQKKITSDISSSQHLTDDSCLERSESESMTVLLQDSSCSPKSRLDQTSQASFHCLYDVSSSNGGVAAGSNAEDPVDFVSASKMENNDDNADIRKQDDRSPPLSQRIREVCDSLKTTLCASASTPASTMSMNHHRAHDVSAVPYHVLQFMEPKTPCPENCSGMSGGGTTFRERSTGVKNTLVRQYLEFLNSATKEELKSLKVS